MADFAKRVWRNISEKMVTMSHCEKGMTDAHLVEYFLLIIMISIIVIVMAIKIPELQAKLWTKINGDLFK